MLLDGAHNPASCSALGEFVGNLRRNAPVIWIIAFSKGRDILSCMETFVKRGDSVGCVEFGPVDGMDWIAPADEEDIAEHAATLTGRQGMVVKFGRNIPEAIRWAIKETKERRGMLVGTGSLYLVGDIHRLRRDNPQFA
jgi:folylpolyglutamate synthase